MAGSFNGGMRGTDIEYFEEQQAIMDGEAGDRIVPIDAMDSKDGEVSKRRKSRIGYFDNGRGESKGVGYHYRASSMPGTAWFDGLIQNGEIVNSGIVRKLAESIDPRTGNRFRPAVKGKNKDGSEKKETKFYDFTFSSDKSTSIAWGLSEAIADKIVAEGGVISGEGLHNPEYVSEVTVQAHDEAVKRCMVYLAKNGIVTRVVPEGAVDRSKTLTVPVGEIAGVLFGHKSSRRGDMQMHTHVVMFNICLLPDGKVRTIDNQTCMRIQRAVSALYRGTKNAIISEKLGIAWRRKDEWAEIDGVPDELIELFSKRREDMKNAAAEKGTDLSSPGRNDYLSLATRKAKDTVPPISELKPRWLAEAEAVGWSYDRLINSIEAAAQKQKQERAEKPLDIKKMVSDAITAVAANETVFDRPTLMRAVWEELQTTGLHHEDYLAELERVENSGEVLFVDTLENGDACYTTPEARRKEVELAAWALEAKGIYADPIVPEALQRRFLKQGTTVSGRDALAILDAMTAVMPDIEKWLTGPQRRVIGRLREGMTKHGTVISRHLGAVVEAVEQIKTAHGDEISEELKVKLTAFSKAATAKQLLSEEQVAAIKHASGHDGVCVIQGRAGAGKTTMLRTLCAMYAAAGKTYHLMATGWRQVDVAMKETDTAAWQARAITGFINRVQKGEIELSRDTPIIIDEGGMVGLDHMHTLLQFQRAYGCPIIITGDTWQTAAVNRGQPMTVISRMIGEVVISTVRRQAAAWMRKASEGFTTGHALESIKEYDSRGHIVWCEDTDETFASLVSDYLDSARSDLPRIAEGKAQRTRVVIAATNHDARKLNVLLREQMRELGIVAPVEEEVEINCIVRGQRAPVMPVGFARGDQIILGETLTLDGVRYANGDIGVIQNIWRDTTGEAFLKIRFGSGPDARVRTFAESDFSAHRKKGTEPLVPKLQHAWATTVNASQGMTVDEGYILYTRRTGLQKTYVSMTRHRHWLRMYVDKSRIHDTLLARKGITLAVSKKGFLANEPETKEDLEQDQANSAKRPEKVAPITLEEIKAQAFKEWARPEKKTNVTDFVSSPVSWVRREMAKYLGIGNREKESQDETHAPEVAVQNSDRVDASEVLPVSTSGDVNGAKGTVADHDAEDFNAAAINERARSTAPRMQPNTTKLNVRKLRAAVAGPEVKNEEPEMTNDQSNYKNGTRYVSSAPAKVRAYEVWSEPPIRQEDEAAIKDANLLHYLLDHGHVRKRGESPSTALDAAGNIIGTKYILKKGGQGAKQEDVIVTIFERGGSSFWCSKSGDHGFGVLGWVLNEKNLNPRDKYELILAKKIAREELGIRVSRVNGQTLPVSRPPQPSYEPEPRLTLAQNLEQRWRSGFYNYDEVLSYGPKNNPKKAKRSELIIRAAERWRCESPVPVPYLTARGLTPETQTFFRKDIRNFHPSDDEPHLAKQRVIFALRHPPTAKTGDKMGLVGFAYKGIKTKDDGERHASRSSTGSHGGIHAMGELENPRLIIVAESAIDGMSYWQQLPDEELKRDTLILATPGQPSGALQAALYHYAKNLPDVPVHGTYDRGASGVLFMDFAQKAVLAARPNGPGLEDHRPDPAYKDWNDVVRGIKASDKEATKLAEAEKEQLARLQEIKDAALSAKVTPVSVPTEVEPVRKELITSPPTTGLRRPMLPPGSPWLRKTPGTEPEPPTPGPRLR